MLTKLPDTAVQYMEDLGYKILSFKVVHIPDSKYEISYRSYDNSSEISNTYISTNVLSLHLPKFLKKLKPHESSIRLKKLEELIK